MKRLKLILTLMFAVLLIALLLISISPGSNSNPPRYVLVTNQPSGPSFIQTFRGTEAVPFQEGRFWMVYASGVGPTNLAVHQYLYDLQQHKAVAEVTNGTPLFFNHDGSSLLCEGYAPPSLRDKLKSLANSILARFNPGRTNLLGPSYGRQAVWILDPHNNSAVKIGAYSYSVIYSRRWIPSPGFRYAYTELAGVGSAQELLVCDVEQRKLKPFRFTGDLLGWWDEHQIFTRDQSTNFVAYDIQTGLASNLFSLKAIAEFMAKSGLTNDPAGLAATSAWNGSNYDWYFSGDRRSGLNTNSTFLLKAEPSGPTLKLLLHDFRFQWLGHFDGSGTSYLYPGERGAPGTGGDGSLYLKDLVGNVTHTLLPPAGGNYILARQSGDTLIYSSNRVLWRVDLNTTNAELLFPQSAK
jgi:hypothetical protein